MYYSSRVWAKWDGLASIAISLQLACAYNFEAPAIKAGVLPWYRAVHKKHQLVLQVQGGVLSPR